jgi:hypothetical protein
MAATFPPIVQTLSAPAVAVTSTGDLDYATLNASIGSFAYKMKNIYQYATNVNQLLQPLYLKKYNKFGDKHIRYLATTVDPYQYTSALSTPTDDLSYNFDGNNIFEPTLLPNISLDFRIDIQEMNPSDLLTKGESNFGNLAFFEDYEIDF